MASTLHSRAQQQIEAARSARAASGEETQTPTSASPEDIAAEKTRQRQAIAGAVTPVDTSAAKAETTTAAGATKAEVTQPPAPVVSGKSAATPAVTGGAADTSEANAAAQLAAQAAAKAAAQTPPEVPAAVDIPPPMETIEAGGRAYPASPTVEAGIAGLAARIHALRVGAHDIRTAAMAEQAQGHQLEAVLQAGRSGVADAEAGISTLKQHNDHRKGAVTQAKAALDVSKDKAETVASGAPTVTAKSEEGSQKSAPMASESKKLAADNSKHAPDDPEAAGKSAEQGNKLQQISADMGSIDTTINQTKARAEQLAGEAESAKQTNVKTEGDINATQQAISQVDAKTSEMEAQNAAARARLDQYAAGPARHLASANTLDAQGVAMHTASVSLEARLSAARESYVAGVGGMPARVPIRHEKIQRSGYEGRTSYNPAGAVTNALPSWLTGEEPQSALAAIEHHQKEEARTAAELAEIEKAAGGHFEQLSASQKAGLALRMTGANLLTGIAETNFPKLGLMLLRGFIDPRMSLMGVIQGFGLLASGVANLFSAAQWQKDPLGNALKSSADIATGVTIVLGSVAGLAVAIGIILTAVAIVGSIFSFGAVGVALAPIIAFCGTVASTVGPWALWAAAVALVLHSLVFIKNLIDAATASTANELALKTNQMTEDAQNAGNMALQIGMAKAMEGVGKLLKGGPPEKAPSAAEPASAPVAEPAAPAPKASPAELAPAPVAEPAPAPKASPAEPAPAPVAEPAPAPKASPAEPAPAPANDNALPMPANDNALPMPANDNALPMPANDNALPISQPQEQVLLGTGTDGPVHVGEPPKLTVIEGGAGSPTKPVAMGAEGPHAGGGPGPSTPEPGYKPSVESPSTAGPSQPSPGKAAKPGEPVSAKAPEPMEPIEGPVSEKGQAKKLTPEEELELKKLTEEQAAERAQGDVGETSVNPGEEHAVDLPENQGLIGDASDEFAKLTNIESGKNIAGAPGADPKTSGWGEGKIGSTEKVQIEGMESGHETEPHPFDPPGSEGLYESSHSERQQAVNTGQRSLASSKILCLQCQRWFAARAVAEGQPYAVADPSGVHFFHPNGSHTVAPHPSGAVTN